MTIFEKESENIMPSPSISLCMIVKNEEDFIAKCLESVHDFVDELIIVDTGSTDQTISICQKYEAKIFSYQWNEDFSAARNYGLSKASGDWIIWIDADEVLESKNRQLIIDTISNTETKMFYLPIINYYGEDLPVNHEQAYLYYQPRLFRNHLGIKFQNRIHEIPKLPNDDQTQSTIEVPVHHYGYIQEITTRKNKSARNLQILYQESQTPDHSPWIDYHLASELYRNQEYDRAFEHLNTSIYNFIFQGFKPPAILYRLKYEIILETNSLDNALPGIDQALKLYPDYVDLVFIKGLILFHTKNYPEALACFETCLELGENHQQYLIMKGLGSFMALEYKQACLDKFKEMND